MSIKKLTLAAASAALAGAIATPAFAQDAEVSFSAGMDTVTEYVFRGVSLGGTSLQPYGEVSIEGFTIGAWYSVGVGAESDIQADEIDIYASYSLPLEGPVSVDVGGTYYHYPQTGEFLDTDGGSAGTYEVFASAGFGDLALAPSVTAYYDFTLEAFTLEGSAGYSWPLEGSDWSVDAGLTAGLVEADGGGDYQWGTASLGLSKPISDSVSFYVAGNFSVNSEDNTLDFERVIDPADPLSSVAANLDDTLFWAGTGISFDF